MFSTSSSSSGNSNSNRGSALAHGHRSRSVVMPVRITPWHRLRRGEQVQAPTTRARSATEGANQSFEDEEDLDRGLAEELDRIVNPSKAKKQVNHLDLLWSIGKVRKPEKCSCCEGSGEKECDWCHGTGVLTVGDTLVCSTSDHSSKCPVCNANGYTKCEHCRGTGFRAQWLSGDGPGQGSNPNASKGR